MKNVNIEWKYIWYSNIYNNWFNNIPIIILNGTYCVFTILYL